MDLMGRFSSSRGMRVRIKCVCTIPGSKQQRSSGFVNTGLKKDDTSMEDQVFVHDKGLCESDSVGPGTRIWAFAHVLDGASIGRKCNIGGCAFIEGDVVVGDEVTIKNGALLFSGVELGDRVFVGPGVVFTNDRNPRSCFRDGSGHLIRTRIGDGATICANVTVVCGVNIGRYAFVGAGSVVTRDLPDYSFAVGVPAKIIGWSCTCGHRLNGELVCSICQREFRVSGHTILPGSE